MKDHKGYAIKTKMDWQDKVVLAACAAATVILALITCGGGTP